MFIPKTVAINEDFFFICGHFAHLPFCAQFFMVANSLAVYSPIPGQPGEFSDTRHSVRTFLSRTHMTVSHSSPENFIHYILLS